jgi:hypothetical protein
MATFSPTFAIDIVDNIASTESTIVTNPGQAFEVIAIHASGANTAVVTVAISGGATIGTAKVITADGGSSFDIVDGQGAVSSTQNISVAVATANVDRVTIICRSAVASTWTNSTPA